MEKEVMKGDLSVSIQDKIRKIRFKAGAEQTHKVNTVIIDVEQSGSGDNPQFTVHVVFNSEPK